MGMKGDATRIFLIGLAMAGLCLSSAVIAVGADPVRGEPILPVPAEPAENREKVALGEQLFHEARLSADDSISCAHCHPLKKGGVDGLPRSPGVDNQLGVINTPTVYNARFNLAQFWDGSAASLEEQVEGPVHNPLEMASNWEQVLGKLRRDKAYVEAFSRIYPDGLTAANIRDAVAAFERTLVTLDSPFDRWLRGDDQALTTRQSRGYHLFKSYGCVACHQGVNVGGNMYQLMGAMGDYFGDRPTPAQPADLGRYNVTGDEADRHMFKVPSLRLASRTPPYFHDASVDTLDQAIQMMAKYQLGRDIPRQDREDIAAFIESLSGKNSKLVAP
jgi:cytochrome c peroxidase